MGDGQSDPVTLRLGYPFPADHPLHVQVLEPWAEDLRAATDGSVTIEFHAEQALSPAAETYANVVAGGQDLGWAVQGYSPGRFPATPGAACPRNSRPPWRSCRARNSRKRRPKYYDEGNAAAAGENAAAGIIEVQLDDDQLDQWRGRDSQRR